MCVIVVKGKRSSREHGPHRFCFSPVHFSSLVFFLVFIFSSPLLLLVLFFSLACGKNRRWALDRVLCFFLCLLCVFVGVDRVGWESS